MDWSRLWGAWGRERARGCGQMILHCSSTLHCSLIWCMPRHALLIPESSHRWWLPKLSPSTDSLPRLRLMPYNVWLQGEIFLELFGPIRQGPGLSVCLYVCLITCHDNPLKNATSSRWRWHNFDCRTEVQTKVLCSCRIFPAGNRGSKKVFLREI